MTKRDKKCIDCNILILRSSSRCQSCAQHERFTRTNVWNKGTKGIMKANKTSFIKNDPRISGENAYQWKGNFVGYIKLHYWVQKNLGKAFWCTWCFSCKNIQWANISHQYKRELNDWIQLCVKCHKKYDSKNRGHSRKYFDHSGRRIYL